jgi:hypothetical protein
MKKEGTAILLALGGWFAIKLVVVLALLIHAAF